MFMNRYLKEDTLTNSLQITLLFNMYILFNNHPTNSITLSCYRAKKIKKQTPSSFELNLKILGFTKASSNIYVILCLKAYVS